MDWKNNTKAEAMLIRHYNEGLSASVCATLIGAAFGVKVSRNAVIGRWHRLKLPRRGQAKVKSAKLFKPTPKDDNSARLKKRLAKAAEIRVAIATLKEVHQEMVKAQDPKHQTIGVSLLDLERHHCRYIISADGAPAMFCGVEKKDGSSWCPEHHSRCYQGIPKTRATRPMRREAA